MLLLIAGGGVRASDHPVSREYQVKAAFLFNFAKFIEWPHGRFSANGGPLVIGTYCADAFGVALEAIVRGRRINGRSVEIRALHLPLEARASHLVFVCASSDTDVVAILEGLLNYPVATVGETDRFGAQGGMVNFVVEDDKVRFDVNVDSAQRAGLKVSAQLQKLARAVRGGH